MMDPSLPLLTGRETLGNFSLADLSYSNQTCLSVSSEVIVSWIRANNQAMKLHIQAYP